MLAPSTLSLTCSVGEPKKLSSNSTGPGSVKLGDCIKDRFPGCCVAGAGIPGAGLGAPVGDWNWFKI